MFGLTREEATLLAACIAAVVSLLTLLVTLVTSRQAEQRQAQRSAIQPSLALLGEQIHEVMALAHVTLRAVDNDEASRKKWLKKARAAGEALKVTRRQVRYSLWGLDEGIHKLSRVPDWTSHLLDRPASAELLLKRADSLREALDRAIHQAYMKGRTPGLHRRALVNWRAYRLASTRKSIMAMPKEERT